MSGCEELRFESVVGRRGRWLHVQASGEQVRSSLSFINHYDFIETPGNRVEILDLSIPATDRPQKCTQTKRSGITYPPSKSAV